MTNKQDIINGYNELGVGDEKEISSEERMLRNVEMIVNKRDEAKKMNIDEKIKSYLVDLPPESQQYVSDFYERLRMSGMKEELLIKEIFLLSQMLSQGFIDTRFGINKKEFAKFKTIELISEIVENENFAIDDFKKIARISFDLNGLKAVNDLTGSHDRGDEYLGLMVKALKSDKVENWLKKKNIKAEVTSIDGGDEFGMILSSNVDINVDDVYQELVEEIIMQELWDSAESKNILDFDDEEILVAFAGIDNKNWKLKTVIEKVTILEQIKKEIPAGYYFRAAVSGGVATLYENFENIELNEDDTFEKYLMKTMGSMFDTSDKKMQINKTHFKAGLAQSSDPYENFLLKVYSRTENEKELRFIIDVYESFLKNLEEAVADSVTEVLPKLIEDVKKEIKKIKQRMLDNKK